MQHVTTFAKTKMNKIALLASGFIVAAMAMTVGLSATTSADGWSGNNGSWNGNNWNNNWNNNWRSHDHDNRSRLIWVFVPQLHRWVLISVNTWGNNWNNSWGNNW